MARLNIALTLPGEAALGTYEAGAVSALIVAVQSINREDPGAVAVDVMTGASSGSLTAVLAAAALLTGHDPVEPLRRAWVSEPTLDSLRAGGVQAPLSLDRARTTGHAVIRDVMPAREDSCKQAQRAPVSLEFALTSLRGFTYSIAQRNQPVQQDPIKGTSYIDWALHQFGPDDLQGAERKWSAAIDSAIASASLPLAFAPVLLNREAELEQYRANQVTNLPDGAGEERPLRLWYADGGLVDREPLGRCMYLVRARDTGRGARRVVLVTRPCPDDTPGSDDMAWSGEDDPPRWRAALGRALRVLVTHSTYEDVRTVRDTNDRIAWCEQLREQLVDLVPDDRNSTQALSGLVQTIHRQRAADGGRTEPLARDLEGLLDQALKAVSGLSSKARVNVEVVAARSSSDVSGAAVGFAAERMRATDFLVGYDAMVRWMDERLEHYLIAAGPAATARLADDAVRAARERASTIPGWVGQIPMRRRPSLRLSAKLLRVGVRTARAGIGNPRARARP